MPNVGDPSIWAEFGLAGLVIFALFTLLMGVAIYAIKRFDVVDARHNKHSNDMAELHSGERKEWRDNSSRQIEKFENAITRLADGIRDTRK